MESLTEDMVQAAEAIIDEVSQPLPAQRAALTCFCRLGVANLAHLRRSTLPIYSSHTYTLCSYFVGRVNCFCAERKRRGVYIDDQQFTRIEGGLFKFWTRYCGP